MTWIKRHTDELTRLVRDGWSWDDLARVLDLGGIRYQSGTAIISGGLLRRKAGLARADERKRQSGDAQPRSFVGKPAERPSPAPVARTTADAAVPPGAAADGGDIEAGEPAFRLVSTRDGYRAPHQEPAQAIAPREPLPATLQVTDDELVQRILGNPPEQQGT